MEDVSNRDIRVSVSRVPKYAAISESFHFVSDHQESTRCHLAGPYTRRGDSTVAVFRSVYFMILPECSGHPCFVRPDTGNALLDTGIRISLRLECPMTERQQRVQEYQQRHLLYNVTTL